MGARRGNSKRIKELLRLNTEEVEMESHGSTGSNGGGIVESAASAGAVTLEVAPDGPLAAPATPPPFVDGVTLEEDTLLHVVAACGDGEDFIECAKMIVRDKKRKGGAAAVCLALEARNNKGDTPLHCAARAGNTNMIGCLIDLIPSTTDDEAAGAAAKKALVRTQNECGETALHQAVRAASKAAIDKLLSVDPELACSSSRAQEKDAGAADAVKMLLERCPDCATLRDANGRTLLHVAAEEGRSFVVNYVCQQSQTQRQRRRARPRSAAAASAAATARLAGLLSSILNAQDINGDTPLHRAVLAVRLQVARRLIRNQQGMRPIDGSWTTMPLEAYYAWDFRITIRRSLLQVGAPYGENDRGDLFRKKCILPKKDEEKMSTNLTAASQVLALFSVLITTVTFASAFTLPGGSRSAGDGSGGGVAGTPVLGGPRRSYVFDAFILADALAFGFSLLATSILLYAGVPAGSLDNRFRVINLAYGLMWQSAGRSLLAAFGLGLFMVLLPVARSIAIGVAVLMILFRAAILRPSAMVSYLAFRCDVASKK